MTDEQLLVDFLTDHDGSAFEALVRQYGPMVWRVCRDILGDREHAEDAFQATFLVLLRRAESIRRHESLGRWLYEVASRVSRREQRRLARFRSRERQAPVMEAAAPPDLDPADRESKPILHEEINRLPSKLRDAIVLCYFEGLTVDDAARRLGCPLGTLKSRLGKGRDLLRDRLTRRGLAASVLLMLMFSLTEEASATVPDSLLDETVQASSHGPSGLSLSRRVASMVLREEAWNRWTRMTVSWSLLVILILIFGVSRLAQGHKADAAPSAPSAVVPNAVPSALSGTASDSNPEPMPGSHCKAR